MNSAAEGQSEYDSDTEPGAAVPMAACDDVCPRCGARLRGLTQLCCPLCRQRLTLRRTSEAPTEHIGRADKEPPALAGPVLDCDIACSECAYNLRGLTALRCPECGTGYVLDIYRLWTPPLPRRPLPTWPLVWNILVHPASFWSRKVVFKAEGPSARQAVLLILLPSVLMTAGVWMTASWQGTDIFVLLVVPLILGITVLALGLMHASACAIALPRRDACLDLPKAVAVVAYSAIWAIPPLSIAAIWLVTWGAARPVQWMYGLLLALTSLPWAVSLYCGGRAAGGSRPHGLWCAATNPFWWLAALVLLAWLS